MKTRIANFSDVGIFENCDILSHLDFCPQIRYMTEISKDETGIKFNAYLPFNVELELCCSSHHEAIMVRREMVARIVACRGKDQIIFSNGIDGDIALVSKVVDVTEIFEKDSRAGFSLTIASAPCHLHLVFNDVRSAAICHGEICARVEFFRRERFRVKVASKN